MHSAHASHTEKIKEHNWLFRGLGRVHIFHWRHRNKLQSINFDISSTNIEHTHRFIWFHAAHNTFALLHWCCTLCAQCMHRFELCLYGMVVAPARLALSDNRNYCNREQLAMRRMLHVSLNGAHSYELKWIINKWQRQRLIVCTQTWSLKRHTLNRTDKENDSVKSGDEEWK